MNYIDTPMNSIGIYSFPRTGSNWLRMLLYAILTGKKHFAMNDVRSQIPDLHDPPGSCEWRRFRTASEVYTAYKTHSYEVVETYNGVPMNNRRLIYIYRHPLDVLVSYIHYISLSVANDDRFIIKPGNGSSSDDLYAAAFMIYGTIDPFFPQAGTWVKNYSHWFDKRSNGEDVLLVRYEDMLQDVEGTVQDIIKYLGLPQDSFWSRESIDDLCEIDGGFFWQKRSGYYREYLSDRTINMFEQQFGAYLNKFGYAV